MVRAKNSYEWDMMIEQMRMLSTAIWEPDKISSLMNPHRAKIFDSIKSTEEREADAKYKMKLMGAALQALVRKRKKKQQ